MKMNFELKALISIRKMAFFTIKFISIVNHSSANRNTNKSTVQMYTVHRGNRENEAKRSKGNIWHIGL